MVTVTVTIVTVAGQRKQRIRVWEKRHSEREDTGNIHNLNKEHRIVKISK